MTTFKTYFKKEIMESIRQYRYIVLAFGIVAFAIIDPIMLKLLPKIIERQLPEGLSALFVASPKIAVNNYIKDLFQIGNLFVVFVLGGILSDEITTQKFVFPYSKGSNPSAIVLAKVIHYTGVITGLTVIGFFVAHYYSHLLFTGDILTYREVFEASILMSAYFLFYITLATLLSSIFKKGLAAGFTAMFISFLSIPLSNLQGIGKLLPYKLIGGANLFSISEAISAFIFALVCSMIFIGLSIYRMNKVEVI